MNRVHDTTENPQQLRLEADLASCMEALYRDWPMLSGFAVREDLMLSEVACYPMLHASQTEDLFGAIAAALGELVEERPEAADLLRGRTFVRSLH